MFTVIIILSLFICLLWCVCSRRDYYAIKEGRGGYVVCSSFFKSLRMTGTPIETRYNPDQFDSYRGSTKIDIYSWLPFSMLSLLFMPRR